MKRPDIAFYGDDFTGSTDALEVLARADIETVLFLRTPESGWLDRFSHCRAVGIAGASRSRSPQWMDENLPPVFEWLKATGAGFCHYKVCSTFDSSPQIGSIGRAIDIGQRIFETRFVPVVVGVPALRRYLVFGNLFATVGDETYRIDRHPAMSRHPVTPMDEGDLRVHLGGQTEKKILLMDLLALRAPDSEVRFRELEEKSPDIILFDTLDDASLREVGSFLWKHAPAPQTFAAGSSGVEYALVSYWRSIGLLPEPPSFPSAGAVDRIVVLSGSCSPVTEQQILWARHQGFDTVAVNAAALAGGEAGENEMTHVIETACEVLKAGRSIVLYTACGPQDRIETSAAGREALGRLSGTVLHKVLQRSGVRRVVVAGGDTSSHAGQELGLYALTFLTPAAPGAPICRAYSECPERNGVEIVFKGGQCGGDDFFELVRLGGK